MFSLVVVFHPQAPEEIIQQGPKTAGDVAVLRLRLLVRGPKRWFSGGRAGAQENADGSLFWEPSAKLS